MATNIFFFLKSKVQWGIVFGIFIFLVYSCRDTKSFLVEGDFTQAVPTPIKLYLLLEEGATLIDSIYLNEGTHFKLQGDAEIPSIYLIKYLNGQSIYLVIHPEDQIKLTINNSTREISYYVEGSADSKLINELIRKQNIVLNKIDQLSKKIAADPNNSVFRTEADSIYARLLKEHKVYTINFIYSNPKSLANIMALYQNFGVKTKPLFDRQNDIKIFDFVDSNLISLYPGSVSIKILDRQIAETKEQLKQKKYYEGTVTEGRMLNSFTALTTTGDTVSFIDIAYTLNILYYWASWNEYSMRELINLNNLLKKTTVPVNVITVSLDNSESELKKAMQADSIKTPVVCEYKYWDSELVKRYSIKRIPSLIMTNDAGVVVAKDIYSNELLNKISQYE